MEADLPGCLELDEWRVLGAEGGAGAGCSGKVGWGNRVAGLSAGVPAADDPPLSKVSPPRPESVARGDGDSHEPSDSPGPGESRARRFPFLTAVCVSSICLMRNSRISS
jgi:hypothetical protein